MAEIFVVGVLSCFSKGYALNTVLRSFVRRSRSTIPPAFISMWLERAPVVLLAISAFAFVIGLNLFTYLSSQVCMIIYGEFFSDLSSNLGQPFFVSLLTNIFTALHGLCLIIAVVWYLCRRKQNSFLSNLLLHSAEEFHLFLKKCTLRFSFFIVRIFWIPRLAAKLLVIWIKLFMVESLQSLEWLRNLLYQVEAEYAKNLHFHRNIYW